MGKSGYCQISGEYCDSLDEHHLIPREFGGINGPTIFISPTIHQTIHRIFRDDKKVSQFISRYPKSAFQIRQVILMLRYANENLTKVFSGVISISMNKFNETEKKVLTLNAEKANISISDLIVLIVKKTISNLG